MGRLTSSSIPSKTESFAYDMLGRLTSAVSPINGVNKTVSYQWDLAGRNRRITYPTEGGVSLFVEYDYLVTGEMTEIRENQTAVGSGVLAKYSYDNLGRRTSIARAGGTAMTTSYAYFANDTRLQTLAHNLSGSANDLTLGFAWTPASQIDSRTASNDAYSWTAHYNEDLLATLNGLNQVTAFGAAITYDARGNLDTDGTNDFDYDPQNRLVSATAAGATASLKYDALGRLYEVVKGSSTARFLYSGTEIIAEYDAAGLKTRWVRGAGPDEALVEYQGGTTLANKRWLIADERGSIIGAANSTGASQWKNAYNEYGRPAPSNTGRFQYTGQLWLFEANLYHYKARLYSPGLGRFLQTDPIGYADGLNLYAYVGGDPVNLVDPSGLEIDEIVVTGTCTPKCDERPSAPGFPSAGFTGSASEGGLGRFDNITDEILVQGTRPPKTSLAGFGIGILVSELVRVNRERGDRARDCVAQDLENQGYVVTREVTFLAPPPSLPIFSRIDIVAYSPAGNYYNIIEVKLGTGRLSFNQKVVFPYINNGTAIPIGGNAAAAGFQTGRPLAASALPFGEVAVLNVLDLEACEEGAAAGAQ